MTTKQARETLSRLWPYLRTRKQRLAVCTVMLLVFLAPREFDSVHLHIETAPDVPTTVSTLFASGNSTATTVTRSFHLPLDSTATVARGPHLPFSWS